MKQPSTNLFELVKTFSAAERSAIKQTLTKNKQQNVYLKLFNYLDHHAHRKGYTYNEVLMQTELQIENLPVIKNQLYQLLAAWLIKNTEPTGSVRKYYRRIEFVYQLMGRGLFKHALAEIKTINKLATEGENFEVLIYLSQIELEFIENFYAGKEMEKKMKEAYDNFVNYTSLFMNLARHTRLNNQLIEKLFAAGGNATRQEIQEPEMELNLLFDKLPGQLNRKLNLLRLANLKVYYQLNGQTDKATAASRENLDYLLKYTSFRTKHPVVFLSAVLNHFDCIGNYPTTAEYKTTLSYLETAWLPAQLQAIYTAKFFPYLYNYFLYSGQLKQLDVLVENYIELINREAGKMEPITLLQNNIYLALYYLLKQNTAEALKYLHQNIQPGKPRHYPVYYLESYLWQVLIYCGTNLATAKKQAQVLGYHLKSYFTNHRFERQLLTLLNTHIISQQNNSGGQWQKVYTEICRAYPKEVREWREQKTYYDPLVFIYSKANNIPVQKALNKLKLGKQVIKNRHAIASR